MLKALIGDIFAAPAVSRAGDIQFTIHSYRPLRSPSRLRRSSRLGPTLSTMKCNLPEVQMLQPCDPDDVLNALIGDLLAKTALSRAGKIQLRKHSYRPILSHSSLRRSIKLVPKLSTMKCNLLEVQTLQPWNIGKVLEALIADLLAAPAGTRAGKIYFTIHSYQPLRSHSWLRRWSRLAPTPSTMRCNLPEVQILQPCDLGQVLNALIGDLLAAPAGTRAGKIYFTIHSYRPLRSHIAGCRGRSGWCQHPQPCNATYRRSRCCSPRMVAKSLRW